MPKKTKKEKILAEYRKKIKFLKKQLEIKDYPKISTPKIPFKQEEKKIYDNIQSNPSKTIKENYNSLIRHYFFNDLKFSFLLSFLLIALEIFLYFAKLVK
jgi:hypothetical protein